MEKMIRDSLIDMLSSAPYPLSLLNNDKDTHINAILAFYKKDPNTDPQVFKNYFWQQLKQKGISDADINKAFIEMDKKDDEMRKKRKEDGIEFQL
jgi:membrane-bound lytic murein transglycosylase B